jgi:Flp pilus assembly protein TadG
MTAVEHDRRSPGTEPVLRRRPNRDRRGAALVEFAIVTPVLLVLVLGMIEVGRAVMVTEVLTYAARMGARTGAISSGSTANAKTAANAVLTDSGITGATVNVFVNGSNLTDASAAKSGDQIAVSVTIPYANVTWLSNPEYLDGKTLSGRVVMRKE